MATIASVSSYPDLTSLGSPQRGDLGLSNALAMYSMNRLMATATIAIATDTTQVKTTATATFTIGGKFQAAVTATDPCFALGGTTCATVVQKSSWQKYILCWDSTGASGPIVYEATQSSVASANVTWNNINTISPWGALITVLNSGVVVVGHILVATNSSHTFTPGTTALGATGITTTYFDGLPPSMLPLIGNDAGLIVGSGT